MIINPPISNNYIYVAHQSFLASDASQHTKNLIDANAVTMLLDRNEDNDRIEQMAAKILSECPLPSHQADGKRYRFAASHREKLLQMVFDYSFKHDAKTHIEAAEKETSAGEKFYSNWKKVVCIAVPKITSSFFGDPCLQTVVSVVVFIGTFYFGFLLFEATTFAFSAHIIPFVINNTPLEIIRVGNTLLQYGEVLFDYKKVILDYLGIIVIVLFVAHNVFEIPFANEALRAVSRVANYLSPLTIVDFLCLRVFDVITFATSTMSNISSLFHEIARKSEQQRIMICKARSYQIWTKIVRENAPHLQARIDFEEQKIA